MKFARGIERRVLGWRSLLKRLNIFIKNDEEDNSKIAQEASWRNL